MTKSSMPLPPAPALYDAVTRHRIERQYLQVNHDYVMMLRAEQCNQDRFRDWVIDRITHLHSFQQQFQCRTEQDVDIPIDPFATSSSVMEHVTPYRLNNNNNDDSSSKASRLKRPPRSSRKRRASAPVLPAKKEEVEEEEDGKKEEDEKECNERQKFNFNSPLVSSYGRGDTNSGSMKTPKLNLNRDSKLYDEDDEDDKKDNVVIDVDVHIDSPRGFSYGGPPPKTPKTPKQRLDTRFECAQPPPAPRSFVDSPPSTPILADQHHDKGKHSEKDMDIGDREQDKNKGVPKNNNEHQDIPESDEIILSYPDSDTATQPPPGHFVKPTSPQTQAVQVKKNETTKKNKKNETPSSTNQGHMKQKKVDRGFEYSERLPTDLEEQEEVQPPITSSVKRRSIDSHSTAAAATKRRKAKSKTSPLSVASSSRRHIGNNKVTRTPKKSTGRSNGSSLSVECGKMKQEREKEKQVEKERSGTPPDFFKLTFDETQTQPPPPMQHSPPRR